MELKYNRVIFRILLVSFAVTMLLVSAGTVSAEPDKITICHNTGSEKITENNVSISAWGIHQEHGDTMGPCQSPISPAPELPTAALMGSGMLGLLFISRRIN